MTVACTLFHEVLFYSIFISLIFNKRFGVALLGAWLALILFNWTYIEHGHWSFWNTIISTHNLSFFLGIAAYWLSSRAYQIGRASCRVRVCQSVYISVVAVSL